MPLDFQTNYPFNDSPYCEWDDPDVPQPPKPKIISEHPPSEAEGPE